MIDLRSQNSLQTKTISYIHLFLFLFLFLSTPQTCANPNLSLLQKQIIKTKQQSLRQIQEQQYLEKKVATAEKKTAQAARIEQQTQKKLRAKKQYLFTLKQNIKKLEKDTRKQQKLLRKLLLSAYMSGQHDFIKLLLNQENISKITRAKSYYHYLNQARLESITALQKTQQQLIKNRKKVTQSVNDLYLLQQQQNKLKNTLLIQKNQRLDALKKLNKNVNYQRTKLDKLNGAAQALKIKLEKERQIRLRKEAEQKQIKQQIPIDKLKGKLKWPIQGKLLARFASRRSGKIKWNGILISANEGEKVKAVASGRVLFAGYFKGYGMVIALEHGDDHITLYAYNQTLLYKRGDRVFAGDSIALAGHSGAQDINSLYFELTYKGKAQDPLQWLQKRHSSMFK